MSAVEGKVADARKSSGSPGHQAETGKPGPLELAIGVGFILLSALAFASTPAFVRLAQNAQVGNISLVAFRCLLAAAVLWLVARLLREPAAERSRQWRLILVGALLFAPQMWTYFAALRHLDTSVAVAIIYIYPALVVAIIALKLRTAPRMVEVLLLGLGLCGVALVVLFNGAGEGSSWGFFLAGVTAIGYALYAVCAGSAVGKTPPLTAASLVLVGGGLSSVLFGLVTGQLEFPATSAGIGLVAIHGLLIMPIGLATYYAGLKRLGPGVTSLVDTSQPAMATMIGVMILGEQLAPAQGWGIVAIVLAVLGLPVIAVMESRRGKLISS